MLRRLIVFGVSFLAGVVLAIVAAIRIAVTFDEASPGDSYLSGSEHDEHGHPWWFVSAEQWSGSTRVKSQAYAMPSARLTPQPFRAEAIFPSWIDHWRPSRSSPEVPATATPFNLEAIAHGWPMRVLWKGRRGQHIGLADFEGALRFTPPRWLAWFFGHDPTLPRQVEIPARIAWRGLLGNAALYSAALYLVFASPGLMRRRRRWRNGACIDCGYPIGSSPLCTECGRELSARDRRHVCKEVVSP